MSYSEPELTIAILDYEREQEANLLIKSFEENLKFRAKILYLINGGNYSYAEKFLKDKRIDTLIINKENMGCGIATRQLFHASMSKYTLYCQVDQWLSLPFTQEFFDGLTKELSEKANLFYIDFAGNQGHGRFSERAFIIETSRYLSIPGIEDIIGSPGPYANYKWGEQHIQEYMRDNYLYFISVKPQLFSDNGKISRRTFPCGGETMHYTDEKRLFILKPLKKRYDDFPNLKLNDAEWELVLSGNFPKEGLIPESDKPHSFIYWK